jgi:hypothetical protein
MTQLRGIEMSGETESVGNSLNDEWMAFAAAEALLPTAVDLVARALLLRGLRLGQIRARGVFQPDQDLNRDGTPREDHEPLDIPVDKWSEWIFLPTFTGPLSSNLTAMQWLVPPEMVSSRICRGYAEVRLARRDVKALATQQGSAHRGDKKKPALWERLVRELRSMFPDKRPPMKNKEIERALKLRPGVGEFASRTLEKALKAAWPKTQK